MTVHLQTDSAGNTYGVWAQRQAMSCAIASMWMAMNQVRQSTSVEGEWDLAQRTFQHAVQGIAWAATDPGANGAPRTINPGAAGQTGSTSDAMFGVQGTGPAVWRSALAANGISVVTTQANGNWPHRLNMTRLGARTPALVGVGWWSQTGGTWQRNSGHVIVAAGTVGGAIVYLDPAGGVLRELPNSGRYGTTGWVEVVLYLSAAR